MSRKGKAINTPGEGREQVLVIWVKNEHAATSDANVLLENATSGAQAILERSDDVILLRVACCDQILFSTNWQRAPSPPPMSFVPEVQALVHAGRLLTKAPKHGSPPLSSLMNSMKDD